MQSNNSNYKESLFLPPPSFLVTTEDIIITLKPPIKSPRILIGGGLDLYPFALLFKTIEHPYKKWLI